MRMVNYWTIDGVKMQACLDSKYLLVLRVSSLVCNSHS